MPADVAITAGRVRVLDATQGRIITVTPEGKLASIFEAGQYGDLSLAGAPAMAAIGEQMYVALADGRIAVVNSTGAIEGIIVPVAPPGQEPLTPGGIAITETAGIWLSDSANHRVLRLNEIGEFELVIGTGAPSASPEGLNTPGGVAIDESGNLYVADTGNGVVKKFSPMGVPLQTIGQGLLGQPTSVAIGDDGTVFVTDKTAQVVAAFGADGWYLGSLGDGYLKGPSSVKTDSGLLYVIDPFAGLFIFQLEPTYASVQ
jgi:streptogramin lyase